MQVKSSSVMRTIILNAPFFVMLFFGIAHLMVYIQLNIGGRTINLSFVNQVASFLYIAVVYLWAMFVNNKRWIRITALGMGCLSLICIAISSQDFGKSINDALCTGVSILTILYVFENAQYLLKQIRKFEMHITIAIWAFVVFSVILFTFFSVKQTTWGEGIYFFGHRYASVCGLTMILVSLKLLTRPKSTAVYWLLLFLSYAICFWTGARVYILSGLGTLYAVIYVFSKGNKDFFFKCTAVTLATFILFFSSSTVTKNTNIAQKLGEKSERDAYGVINAMSNGRPEMWIRCWKSYKALPALNKLVGSGNKYIYDYNDGLNSHMDYLNILHYHGMIGLAAYLLMFICYGARFWIKRNLPGILLVGFWGVWFVLAFLNGYMSYTANMMSVPYIAVMAADVRDRKESL